jgi:hypothetical protein
MLRRLGLTIQAAPSPPEKVLPLAIRDHVRFRQLDLLIDNGFGNQPQDKIPDEVMIAVEEGLPIPFRGPDRDTVFAAPVSERKPEKKRVLDEEKIQRRRDNARKRYEYLYGRKETK